MVDNRAIQPLIIGSMNMVDLKMVKNNEEVKALFKVMSMQIEALGFTEHSNRHSSIVSNWTGDILTALGADQRIVELGTIAGYLHDIGNAVNRHSHAQTGALLAYNILVKAGMDYFDAAQVMMAIGNHDEREGSPVSQICSALIIADKSDVHKSRVRNTILSDYSEMNIHDRVNHAAEKSYIEVNGKTITTHIDINTEISPVVDYFEIYHDRMQMCRRAAKFIGCEYSLVINDVKLI